MKSMNDQKIYLAMIGDIKKSKNISDRYQVQAKLTEVLNDINMQYASSIASKFMITLGDEFQGLLHEGSSALNIIDQIEGRLFPIELRFGIGIGGIVTEIHYDFPIGADGPAYYLAREMITTVHTLEKKTMSVDTNIMVHSDAYENEAIGKLINSTLSLCYILKHRWSQRQREIIDAYESVTYNQQLAASKLGILQSSVNKSLANSSYYSYRAAQKSVTDYLKILCSNKVMAESVG